MINCNPILIAKMLRLPTLDRFKSGVVPAFIITLLGSGTSKLILVGVTFYCTNVLTKDDFGEFSFLRNTLNMILCICVANYMNLCTKFTAESINDPQSRRRLLLLFIFSLCICSLCAILLNCLPEKYIQSIVHSQGLIKYFRLIGWLLPLFMLQPLIEGCLRGLKKFKTIGVLQILSSILFAILVCAGIQIRGYEGAIEGLLIYYVVYSIVSLLVLSRYIHIRRNVRDNISNLLNEMPALRRIVLPVFLLSFIDASVNWWAQVYIVNSSNMESIAGITAVLQIRNMILILPSYYYSTLTTFVASLNAEKKYGSYFRKFDISLYVLCLLAVVGVVCLQLLDSTILGLYGQAYTSDTLAFFISNISIPFFVACNLLKIDLIIMEHQRMMLGISVGGAVLFVIVLYMGVTFWGNAVAGYFVAQLAQIIASYIICQIVYHIDKIRYLKQK